MSLPEEGSQAGEKNPAAGWSRADVERELERNVVSLRAFAKGMLNDSAAVDDILQRVSVKVLQKGTTARPETFRGWLFQVCWNEIQLHRRQEQSRKRLIQQLQSHSRGTESDSLLTQLSQHEFQERLRQVWTTLPEEQSRVVWMRLYEERTFAEIAHTLGVPIGTVISRMQGGLKRLRGLLKDFEHHG